MTIEDGCPKVMTCKWHDVGHAIFTLFVPKRPHSHICNTAGSDQLVECTRNHQVPKQMKGPTYDTKFRMVQVRSGYNGVSTLELSTHINFNSGYGLQMQHEDDDIIRHDDINHLISKKVDNKETSLELAHAFVQNTKH